MRITEAYPLPKEKLSLMRHRCAKITGPVYSMEKRKARKRKATDHYSCPETTEKAGKCKVDLVDNQS